MTTTNAPTTTPNAECVVLTGKTEIAYGRLAMLKGALRLESVGLKTRGGALRPKVAAELGLKARDPYPVFIARVVALMEEALAARAAQVAEANAKAHDAAVSEALNEAQSSTQH